MSKNPNWFPGCGRPHPSLELITSWAKGEVAAVKVSAPFGTPVNQQYPSWRPENDHSKACDKEYMRAFMHDGHVYHVKTKGSWTDAERTVYHNYGTVQWLHDWVELKSGVRPGTERVLEIIGFRHNGVGRSIHGAPGEIFASQAPKALM